MKSCFPLMPEFSKGSFRDFFFSRLTIALNTLFSACVTWLLYIVLQERTMNAMNTKFGDSLLNQLHRTTELLNMAELSSSALIFAEVYIFGGKTIPISSLESLLTEKSFKTQVSQLNSFDHKDILRCATPFSKFHKANTEVQSSR